MVHLYALSIYAWYVIHFTLAACNHGNQYLVPIAIVIFITSTFSLNQRTVSWNKLTKNPTSETELLFSKDFSSIVSPKSIDWFDLMAGRSSEASLLNFGVFVSCSRGVDMYNSCAETDGGHFYSKLTSFENCVKNWESF